MISFYLICWLKSSCKKILTPMTSPAKALRSKSILRACWVLKVFQVYAQSSTYRQTIVRHSEDPLLFFLFFFFWFSKNSKTFKIFAIFRTNSLFLQEISLRKVMPYSSENWRLKAFSLQHTIINFFDGNEYECCTYIYTQFYGVYGIFCR